MPLSQAQTKVRKISGVIAAPAPAPAAPNSSYPGASPAGGSVPPVYGSVSAPVYPGGGTVPPQTPYNPYMQGGQPNGQPGWSGSYGSVPPEANQKYNGLAIAGFICSFFVSLLGLILSIVGLNQIKKQGGKGKGLAIAGIIISAAGMVIQVILVIALIVGGASYASKAIDEAKTDSFYSQSSSGNGDSSDKSKAQDNLDDALDDTLGETHDDLTDGDYGLYDSIQDFVDSSEFKDSIESEADTFADTGITFNYRVDGDTLVYEVRARRQLCLARRYRRFLTGCYGQHLSIHRESAGLDVQDLQRQGIIARHHAHAKRPVAV